MKTYKAGLIGCGSIGARYDERKLDNNIYTHAGLYHHSKRFEFVCAADNDTKRLKEFGRYWKVDKLYDNPVRMLRNHQIDVLSIATPDKTHYKLILNALNSPCPPRIILSEKPLADNPEKVSILIKKAREKNIKLLVKYILRWDNSIIKIRQMIKENKLGPVQSAVGYYVRGIRHNCCHIINLLRFFFGEIKTVQVFGPAKKGSYGKEPSLSFYTETRNGLGANIIAMDQQGYGFSIFEMDLAFKKGRLRITDGAQKVEFYEPKKSKVSSNFKVLSLSKSKFRNPTYGQAMLNAESEIINYLDSKKQNIQNNATDAYKDLQIIDAVMKSAKSNNRKITIL